MKVLVTGGAGLIGSHVVDQLLAEGHEVRILDNLEQPTHLQGKPDWVPQHAEFIRGDMRCDDDLLRALEGVDWVSHQAAFGGFVPEISKYVHVNVLGTARMLELITTRRLPVRKIVMASSQAVYGEGRYRCEVHGPCCPPLRAIEQTSTGSWEHDCPTCGRALTPIASDESTIIDPATPYAISKYGQERLLLCWGQSTGIPVTALRYSVTYGPRQSIFNPYTGVVAIFSTRILNDVPPVIYEDGSQLRDFVYVDDVARANVHCLRSPATDGQVYNVGSGRPTRLLDLIDTLSGCYGRPVEPLFRGEYRTGEVRHLFSDSAKLQATGWSPATTLHEGLRAYVDWIQTQGDIKEYFSEAESTMRRMSVVRQVEPRRDAAGAVPV